MVADREITPDGCRHCGTEQRDHWQRWTTEARWVAPTDVQRLERMKARRAARANGRAA